MDSKIWSKWRKKYRWNNKQNTNKAVPKKFKKNNNKWNIYGIKNGINKEKIERNDNEEFYTGGSKEKEKIYEENKKQSSTYNAYGVYDLNGGSYEAVAAYINTGGDCLEKNGGIEEGNIYGNTRKENSTSTEYKTVYKVEKQNGKENQQKDYNLAKEKMGDGIYETSSIYISNNGSWFGSYAQYPSTSYPFFIRGGNYTLEYDGKEISSSFCFSSSTGETYYDVGFRTVLVE